MEKEGFLLDIDYITEKDDDEKEKPVIRLWCKSKGGENFIGLDKNFEPYFYAYSPIEEKEKKDVVEKICIRKSKGYGREEEIKVNRVELCTKKILGVARSVLKIFAWHPKHVPLLREEVRKKGFVVLEADILFAIRYLIDNGMRPFDGIKVRGEEIGVGYGGEPILAGEVEYSKMKGLPPLRMLAFDCEMASPYGMPSPKKDPIIIISVAYGDGDEDNGDKDKNKVKTKLFVMQKEDNADDDEIIENFLHFINQLQPDIIVGYNSDVFDWQYLKERAKLHRIRLGVGADGSTPQYSYARGGGVALPDVNIAGRLNVDVYKLARRDLDEVKVKTLENVAEYLGVMGKAERVNLSPREIYECWNNDNDDDNNTSNSSLALTRTDLYAYAEADAVSTLGIAKKMLPLQYELSRIIGYPLDEITKMGRGRQVETFLTVEAFKSNDLVPSKRGDGKTYEGGFVLPPVPGLHEDVVSLDFSSMYPSIMISFNISPDTFVDTGIDTDIGASANLRDDDNLFVAPEVGHAFRKKPDGFFKKIMRELVEKRRAIKEEMKKYRKSTAEYRLLDIQQQSIKILTNSFYGYTGWSAAKFYKRECAEATTAWGRYFIKKAIKMAEEFGFEVIYGDTDSIFAKLKLSPDEEENVKKEGDRQGKILKKAKKLEEKISNELPLELEIKDFFKTIFFTGKKKRYAALTKEGEIMVRGLEVRRGDWCRLAKDVQTKVIEAILTKKDPEKAIKYVKNVIHELKAGKIALDELIIYKTLTRKISDYDTQQAHVIAAEKALASSSHIVYEVGSKIPYVILKGMGKTSDRSFPAEIIEKSEGNEIIVEGRRYEIDTSYYVQHQVIPVAHRILQHFGYALPSFEDVRQKTLGYWFK